MELQQKLTSSLNDLFSTQLAEVAQWNNVAGELDHISASPAGYLWGIQNRQNAVQVSKDPGVYWQQASGNFPEDGRKVDITTDATRAQVLLENGNLQTTPVQGGGSWTKVTVPTGTRRVVATKDFMWAETDRGNFTCAQPCQNGNWTAPSPSRMTLAGSQQALAGAESTLTGNENRRSLMGVLLPSNTQVKLTSASARRAQGVSKDLKAMVNINGEWQEIPGFQNRNVSTVSGEIDDIALQAVSTSGEVLRCPGDCQDPDEVRVVRTPGHSPNPSEVKMLTANPTNKNVWEISGSQTKLGNIQSRQDSGTQDLLEATRDIDRQRDNVVQDLQSDQDRIKGQKQVQDKMDEATDRLHRGRPRLTPEVDPRITLRKIQSTDLGTSLRVVQIALATVFLCLVIFLVLPGSWAAGLSFVVVCTGILLAVSFSTVQR